MKKIINIIHAELLEEFRLHLSFNDGVEQVINFKPFLTQSRHPDIRVFLQPDKFADFRVEYGELVWGDYDLCFPIIDLYLNNLQ